MPVVFKKGETLGRGDLDIFLTNAVGNPTNAAEISYALYYVAPGPPETEVLVPPDSRVPVNPSVGEYYASLLVPQTANLGTYRVRWTFKEFVGSPEQQVVQEWAVVEDSTVVGPTVYSAVIQGLIHKLRILIRDNNPDRNYHFRPPEHEGVIKQFNQVFGYVWEDEELVTYLECALLWFNAQPPETESLCSLDLLVAQKNVWSIFIMWGAIVHAMFALSANWIQEEFDYSIGGISLSIDRSSKYESLKNNAEQMIEKAAETKLQTTKIVRGLSQPRFGVGVRSSFGPAVGRGVLSPRNFVGL